MGVGGSGGRARAVMVLTFVTRVEGSGDGRAWVTGVGVHWDFSTRVGSSGDG